MRTCSVLLEPELAHERREEGLELTLEGFEDLHLSLLGSDGVEYSTSEYEYEYEYRKKLRVRVRVRVLILKNVLEYEYRKKVRVRVRVRVLLQV